MTNLSSPPLYDVFALPEQQTEKRIPKLIAGFEWLRFFNDVFGAFSRVSERLCHVRRTSLAASLATTPTPIPNHPPGVYRVSYRVRVTTPGSVSSSLQFTLAWTEGGIAQSQVGVALVGNLTTTKQDGTWVIRVDVNAPISYATTYADGGGATAMVYDLDVIVEALALDAV